MFFGESVLYTCHRSPRQQKTAAIVASSTAFCIVRDLAVGVIETICGLVRIIVSIDWVTADRANEW